MSLNAAALRLMREKGLSLEDVVEIAAAMEARSSGAERQKRYRERQRDDDSDVTRDVTNSDVTPPSLSPPSPKDPQTPKEPQPPHTLPRKTAPARRLAEDWEPEPFSEGVAAETVAVWQAGRLERELSKFRDYWRAESGAKARKHDWQATWRNWVLKADENGSRLPPTRPPQRSVLDGLWDGYIGGDPPDSGGSGDAVPGDGEPVH